MDKKYLKILKALLEDVAEEFNLEICSLSLLTNQNPMIIKILISKNNKDDITLDDCSRFSNPASSDSDKNFEFNESSCSKKGTFIIDLEFLSTSLK